MRPSVLLSLLAFTACTQEVVVPIDKETGDVDTEDSHDTDPDTDETGYWKGDNDGDGYTVEEGDCDDDNVYVSPARDEEVDGVDNDCDGRLDEVWNGVDVAYLNYAGASSIITIDALGFYADEVSLSDSAVFPLWIDHTSSGGWLINDSYAYVSLVDSAGNVSQIADFSKTDYGVYGVATHPEGYSLATTINQLWRVDEDGTSTVLAEWNADFKDPANFDLAVYTVAVDLVSGEVGMFGLFGGFATWSQDAGLTIHMREDIKAKTVQQAFSGTCRDGGGWYTILYDSATGLISMARFNTTDLEWTVKATWTEASWSPRVLTIDGDSGDYYVTTAAGWNHTVWRMLADGSAAWDFFNDWTDPALGKNPDRDVYGIVSNY